MRLLLQKKTGRIFLGQLNSQAYQRGERNEWRRI